MLRLTDVETGEGVEGEVALFSHDGFHVRFDPSEDLKPEHEYVLRGYADPAAAALVAGPDAGTVEADIEVSFTTGTQKLTKLELNGEVSAVLVPTERGDTSCNPGLC
jgi:hypothetical protein